MDPISACITQVVLKIASRCNLNCSYCYVYNQADSSWKQRPALMSSAIFETTIERLRKHCLHTGQKKVMLAFHGGEPCLVGAAQLDAWCAHAKEVLGGVVEVGFVLQTNATLLDEAWAEVFLRHKIHVGVSLDGPPAVNNSLRVDHAGRGSYADVVRGIRTLQKAGVSFGILCVIKPGADSLAVHRHFLDLGCKNVTYLLPHFTHDNVGPIRQMYGPTPCADYLIPIFEDWWLNCTTDVFISDLENIARLILGGTTTIETLGTEPPRYVFIEANGDLEGLDCLRACEEGIVRIDLNIETAEFLDIMATRGMHKTAIFEGIPLPQGCRSCPEKETCGGGYLPHRYSAARGFDNPSVWCADILKLFAHVRSRLDVSVEETHARRQELRRLARRAPLPVAQPSAEPQYAQGKVE